MPDKPPKIKGATVTPISGGYSGNRVYRVEYPIRSVCLKVFNEAAHADREWMMLNNLQEAGVECVPKPLFRSGENNEAIAMSWCDGVSLGNKSLENTEVEKLAQSLNQFGNVPTDPFPASINTTTRIIERAYLATTALRLNGDYGELVDAMDKLLTDTDILNNSQMIWLGRGDPNLANALYGDKVMFVDFEHAGVNDRAVELADLAEHLQSHENSEQTWDYLWDCLGLDSDERQRILVARCLTAVWWLGELLTNDLAKQLNPPERTKQQAERTRQLLARITGS